ncbi:glucosamine-1-phosphate N-acetyltransferase [Lampropedia cohaerens]|uniref:Bifunctional protein GlmU n=1 Tax=Lampropedia cohaerens TaxID=1610491 RepID=A0A0U1Q265_9BURK|nr:bifunctional UDP-N-acetylglucosamine diphosphorylase/glucosamine-1-phosphate N-acetyltransferase GlmU [Lampropedia cohaerens]KKW68843.1 glucosamine-1-phosphate N-acetyltransferase [Lampropedia cohaerens]
MTASSPLSIVVLAAGKGTRMKSRLPKVLQPLGGRPMLAHVLHTAGALCAERLVLVSGHGGDWVRQFADQHAPALLPNTQLIHAEQPQQLGTGHAVQQAGAHLPDRGTVLILLGDVPLVDAETLQQVVACCSDSQIGLLTAELVEPHGYGRIARDAQGRVQAIVEHKDANAQQRAIREINSGIMALPAHRLKAWLNRLDNDNAQGEYYLTDVIAMAVADQVAVQAHCLPVHQSWQVGGINSPAQLAEAERRYQRLQAEAAMDAGVRLVDPARFELRAAPGSALPGALTCESDVEIDIGCIFAGDVRIGSGSRIGAYCHISQADLGADCEVLPYSHIDGEAAGVVVGNGARIGPFARLRPGARLAEDVHIGNFVEVKNSTLARGAKANHLAYLGDAAVGERVNYGAGAITANYDGANKHRTIIEADVHIGSNSVLVAPLTIGAGATVGAGSTLSRDVPAHALAVTRANASVVPDWQRPAKKKD